MSIAVLTATTAMITPLAQKSLVTAEPITTAAISRDVLDKRAIQTVSRSLVRKAPAVKAKPKPVKPKPVKTFAPVVHTTAWIERVRLCIIAHESGGNPKAHNPSGASGLYQFMPGTWHSITGLPGNAADYSVAIQTAAFYKLFNGGKGARNWVTAGMCGA